MPAWATVIAFAAALPIGALLTIGYQAWTRKGDRRSELRTAGAAVVTPVQTVIDAFSPGALSWGTEEALQAHVRQWQQAWGTHREALMVFANGHPDARVLELANDLAQAVQQQIGAGTYFIRRRLGNMHPLDDYEQLRDLTEEARDAARAILVELR